MSFEDSLVRVRYGPWQPLDRGLHGVRHQDDVEERHDSIQDEAAVEEAKLLRLAKGRQRGEIRREPKEDARVEYRDQLHTHDDLVLHEAALGLYV